MYGISTYGSNTYSQVISSNIETVDSDVVYNGYALQSDSIIISTYSFDNSHSIQSDYFNTPLGDGGTQTNYYFREKIVEMQGYIKSDTAENLNIAIDTLKKKLLQPNKNLDIRVNGQIRRAKASLINADSLFNRDHYHITFLPITLSFRVLEKFKGIVAQTTSVLNQTGTTIESEDNIGTAISEPTFILSFNSASGTDEISINIGNNTLVISQTINTSDVVIVDSYEKTVTINDIEVDYLGSFPKLQIGENTYTIDVNGTVDYNSTIKYFNTYL